jgi:acylphosphatase
MAGKQIITAQITVKGHVQMVGFRYYTVKHAQTLGVCGYVRNTMSGDVEIVAQADEGTMKEFIKLIRKGPMGAVVRDVLIDYEPDIDEDFKEFNLRY